MQTTTGPVVISWQGMLNDLGGNVMVASAYRHCLATETADITTSEGWRADTVIDEDAGGWCDTQNTSKHCCSLFTEPFT